MENQKESGGKLKENPEGKPEVIREVIPEIKLYEKGEGGDDGSERKQMRRWLFMAIVAAAVDLGANCSLPAASDCSCSRFREDRSRRLVRFDLQHHGSDRASQRLCL